MVDFESDFAFSHFFLFKTVVLSSFFLPKVRLKLNPCLDFYFERLSTTK